MSNIEQIDFSTLIWVKKELDETFKRAQAAIEEYVENPEDENQLQFCATYLHQVQGTLKMVELYGAAMVAEEMEQVVKKILNKEVASEKDSFEVLMRGIILLPDYLERIQLGYKDIPMVLLPLVNDLRTVKGDQLLSESALFNPDLSLGLPESNLTSSFTLSQNQLIQVVKKIRSAYQVCLLNWLKNVDVKTNQKKIQIIVDKLKTVLTTVHEKQLFWVAGGLFEALINDGLEESVTVKQLAAKLDQAIRMISSVESKEERYFKELTNNLLYYVALADSKDRRINEIQQFFNLSNFISDDKEIEHAQSSLSGKNRELLESVTTIIKEDLMTIQESLDLYNRNSDATTSDLENIIDSMRKISDTLGIIGIGVARERIRNSTTEMEENIKSGKKLDNDSIMRIAQTLLFVESALDENIQMLGEVKEKNPDKEEGLVSSTEMKKIMDTLAKESIFNLQKIKHNFIQYIEEPWKKETIEASPKLLRDISGALTMSGYQDVAEQIDKIEQYTTEYMLDPDYKPTVNQLNMLAESIASLEYYLEYLSDGIKGEERILELAKSNINSLFETIELAEKHKKQPENIDADLDNMSDDDFDMNDEFEDELGLDDTDDLDYDELLSEEMDDTQESLTEDNQFNQFEESSDTDDFELTLEDESVKHESADNQSGKNEAETTKHKHNDRPKLYVTFGEETDEDIREVFLEEFAEELEHLNSIFPRWESNPNEQMELLGEIRRIYHTLKGSGRLVGALAIGDFSWRIEEMTNLILNDPQRLNDSYILVMKKSTEILPEIYAALKQETVVPAGYYQVIEAANLVIVNKEVNEINFTDMDSLQASELVSFDNDDEQEISPEISQEISPEESEVFEQIDSESIVDEEPSEHEAETNADEELTEDEIDNNLSVDPVFVEILQQEVEGHLAEITNYVNQAQLTGNAKSTDQFIRVVHTLNGAANMASVKSIVEMSTPLELSAKLTNELDDEFDHETITKISEFSQEAANIMKDLANRSASNPTTSALHDYFVQLLEDLTTKKQQQDASSEQESHGFDLSEFVDEEIETSVADDKLDLSEHDLSDADHLDSFTDEESLDFILEEDGETAEANMDFDVDLDVDTFDLESEQDEEESSDAEMDLVDDDEQETEDLDFEFDASADEELDEDLDDVTDDEVEDDIEIESMDDESLATEFAGEIADADVEIDLVDDDEQETEDLDFEFDASVDEDLDEDLEQVVPIFEQEYEHISATISTTYESEEDEHHETSGEIDEELVEIFKEEANDILDRTEHILSELEENPKDYSLILALQRDLHTMKGGARMAGLENIGNLSHVLESLLETIGEENRNVDKNILDTIHESFDLLNKIKDQKDYGESVDLSQTINRVKSLVGSEQDVIPDESKLDLDYFAPIDPLQEVSEDQFEEVEEDDSGKRKANVLSGNQIKVRSELLDNLVNYAGEVSIYRSRLEQEIGSFRVNLSELGNTVLRIKEQLRKLDAETEAQIISTFQTIDDDGSFDPLEMDRFSMLQQLSRSLTESVSDLVSIHSYLDDVARTSDNLLAQQSRVNTELQEGLMETRLVSFNSILPRLRRLVRTTSKELDKPVKLEVLGAEGEMDKTVLEGVIAPLEHMLRSSLAHGIEVNRKKVKKSAEGLISIEVRREATEVVIRVSDDGAGINRKKVKKIAEEKGLIKKGVHISDENIDRLILNSGFTTADEVSKLSGRGVGMDVVSNQINLLGGSLGIKSTPKVGTTFSIRLPYTLALSSALLVEVAETVYAIPVSGLEGIIRMSFTDYQQRVKDKNYIYQYANEDYQLQELSTLLDVESEVVVENNQIPLVMIRSGEHGVALRVDRIIGSKEIVVKTVGAQISSVPGIFGATILGDGNVVLILDIIPLSRSYIEKLANQEEVAQIFEIEEIDKDPIIMIVDDSITMRKVGERILRRNDYDVVTAKDGLDALEQLSEVIPDVMLLDIEMPRMDGYELAIEMKKEEEYAHIPIIMITSRTGEKHRQKAMDLGVDRYLGKPYQEADLLENIRELIEASKN